MSSSSSSSSSLLFNFDGVDQRESSTLLHLRRQPTFISVSLDKSPPLYEKVFKFLGSISELVANKDIDNYTDLRITPESLHFATYTLKIPLNHIKEVLSVFSKKHPLPVDVLTFLDEFSTQTPMGAFKHLEEEGKYPFAIDGNTPSIHPFVLKKETQLRIHQQKAVNSAVVRCKYKKNEWADENESNNSLELAKKRGATLILEEESVCKGECEGGCSDENCGIQIARSGVIEMSCGSGKSLTAISAAMKIGKSFLILCTNAESVVQWKREILTWTTIPASRVCCITGENKDKLPFERGCVVVATYTIFTEARSLESKSMIGEVLKRVWGTLVLDECHHIAAKTISDMLPRIKAKWKLGLSGTLVRKDGGIEDIFKTIGPLLFKADVDDLRKAGSIATVLCTQVSVPMEDEFAEFHSDSRNIQRTKTILSVMNTNKYLMTEFLVNFHERQANTKIIIFIDYLFELEEYSRRLNRPSIHGKTTKEERVKVLKKFRDDPNYKTLLMSRVGDQSLNVPECNVAIQVSAHFGSRRQEGQRLGRILRPKRTSNEGYNGCFYTLVSEDTKEIRYANLRARYLVKEMSCEYREESMEKAAIEEYLQSLGIKIDTEVNKRWTKKTFEECEKLIKDYEVNGKSKKGKNKVSEESSEEEDDDEEEESDESNSESKSTHTRFTTTTTTKTTPLLPSLNTTPTNSSNIGIKRSFPNANNNNNNNPPRLESFTRNTFLSSLSSPFNSSTITTTSSPEKKSKTGNNISILEKPKKKKTDSSTPTLTSSLSTDNFLIEKTHSQPTNSTLQSTTIATIATTTTEIKHQNNNNNGENNHTNHTFPNTNTEKANGKEKEKESDNVKGGDQESEKGKGKGKENVVNAENPIKTTATPPSKPISSLNIVSRKPLPTNKFQPTLLLKKLATATPNPP